MGEVVNILGETIDNDVEAVDVLEYAKRYDARYTVVIGGFDAADFCISNVPTEKALMLIEEAKMQILLGVIDG